MLRYARLSGIVCHRMTCKQRSRSFGLVSISYRLSIVTFALGRTVTSQYIVSRTDRRILLSHIPDRVTNSVGQKVLKNSADLQLGLYDSECQSEGALTLKAFVNNNVMHGTKINNLSDDRDVCVGR